MPLSPIFDNLECCVLSRPITGTALNRALIFSFSLFVTVPSFILVYLFPLNRRLHYAAEQRTGVDLAKR